MDLSLGKTLCMMTWMMPSQQWEQPGLAQHNPSDLNTNLEVSL